MKRGISVRWLKPDNHESGWAMCLLCRLLLVMAACATLSLPSFGALQVKYAEGTNPDWADELDTAYIR